MKERLNELTNENTGLAELVAEKNNGLKYLQSEIERLGKELRMQGVDIDVRYDLQILCSRPFYLDNIPRRSKLSKPTS